MILDCITVHQKLYHLSEGFFHFYQRVFCVSVSVSVSVYALSDTRRDDFPDTKTFIANGVVTVAMIVEVAVVAAIATIEATAAGDVSAHIHC